MKQIEKIRSGYDAASMSTLKPTVIAERLGVSAAMVYKFLRSQAPKEDKEYIEWTKREEAFLLENYKTMGDIALGKALGRSDVSVRSKIVRMGIKRTSEERRSIYKTLGRRMPINPRRHEEGAILKYGHMKYHLIVRDGKPIAIHRDVWERAHGPIPKGYIVTYVDGNPENYSIDNLRLMPRGEAAKQNVKVRMERQEANPEKKKEALAKYRQSMEERKAKLEDEETRIKVEAQKNQNRKFIDWLMLGYRPKDTKYGTLWI